MPWMSPTKKGKTWSERDREHKARESARMKRWRERCWLAGICRQCGADYEGGFTLCPDCREKGNARCRARYVRVLPHKKRCIECNHIFYTRLKAGKFCSKRCKMEKYHRERRAYRRACNLCLRCGKKLIHSLYVWCYDCRRHKAELDRQRAA